MRTMTTRTFTLIAIAALVLFGVGRVEAAEFRRPLVPPEVLRSILSDLILIPPAWNQILPATGPDPCNSLRFTCVMGGEAVLDHETGLVWDRSPDPRPVPWLSAQQFCNVMSKGGRSGWRLPTIQELASLLDPNNPRGNPDLPPGNPFRNVQSTDPSKIPDITGYWSATTGATETNAAWFVFFALLQEDGLRPGGVGGGPAFKSRPFFFWCVRGGQGVDPQ